MPSKKKRRMSKKMLQKRRKRKMIFFGLVLLCLLLLSGISYFMLYRSVSKIPQDKICDNVYIGKAEVSGLTKKQAAALMKQHLEKDETTAVTLKVGKKSDEATLKELGLSCGNLEEAVNEAVNYGKKGSLWKRYRQINNIKKEKVVIDAKLALSSKKAEAVFTERVIEFTNHAVNAKITKNGDKFKISKEKEGETFDTKASVKKITAHLNGGWNHKAFSVKMVLQEELPSIKAAELKTIKDELGSFSTDAGGGQRWQNLKTGVGLINGSIIMPDETFSVHDATAPYDEEHGYVEAGSYENGQVVDSFGGGICQVSTTLYNAVLYAELGVEERYPHSMLVAYVDPSRDAAIAGDVMDFKFTNTYKTPVYISGEIDSNNQLRFVIYGKETRDENRTVEYESETLATEEYGVTYKENPEAPLGAMQYTGNPHTGKTARLWKVVTQDGEEVSRDIINNSQYAKADEIIEVGTKSDNGAAAAAVRQAIGTQDQGKINAAIAQSGS